MMSSSAFAEDLKRSRTALEDVIGCKVPGYRAPCFSLDRERLDIIQEHGYAYDSSRILFDDHPLYGTLDLSGFEKLSPNIFRRSQFIEFQVSTLKLLGKHMPVSGGGYLRIFPWMLMQWWVRRYLATNELYVLYVHPFELSRRRMPPLPRGTRLSTRFRAEYGRSSVSAKLESLIGILKANGFEFTTFTRLHDQVVSITKAERT
jgi:hypothetical protein